MSKDANPHHQRDYFRAASNLVTHLVASQTRRLGPREVLILRRFARYLRLGQCDCPFLDALCWLHRHGYASVSQDHRGRWWVEPTERAFEEPLGALPDADEHGHALQPLQRRRRAPGKRQARRAARREALGSVRISPKEVGRG